MIDVLLDARETRRMSAGMRIYVRELAERLPLVAPDIQMRTVTGGDVFSFTEQVELPFASRHADVVHFPTIFAPVMLPRRYVVTVHDLIHMRWPELFSRTTAVYYKLFVRRLLKGAARVVVGDERTVVDCERFFHISPDRVRVVPLGYDPALLANPARHSDRPYVLYVGNHRPHKNLSALLAAWERLPAGIALDLALTGEDDMHAARRHRDRGLIFLGDLSPAEVGAAISGATALVQPSLAEGFGLPVLEALVRGVPVIAAEEAFPQMFAPYVLRFAPRDIDALAVLLEEAANAPQRLRAQATEGTGIARTYTWDRFATTIAGVYREAAEARA
ncbi:MAG: glycosyltransferase family 4 protein [Vulcanimicrobiaceae bacterium]